MNNTKKRDLTFTYIYALLIIMVIDDHCTARINILNNIFPYNSFYMPMFVFVSGYFFKQRGIKELIVHKGKRLFVPYMIWNVVALGIGLVIDAVFGTAWIGEIDWVKVLGSVIYMQPFRVNGAAWFVLMLFWVSIVYGLIWVVAGAGKGDLVSVEKPGVDSVDAGGVCQVRHGTGKLLDLSLTVAVTGLAIGSVWMCKNHYPDGGYSSYILISLYRTLFFMCFYNWGHMFRKYVEKPLEKWGGLVVVACVVINIVLTLTYGEDMNFYSTSLMDRFRYVLLPFVTSATGILFYYIMIHRISQSIGEIRLLEFIGRNTFTIMQIHLVFVNIPNFYVYMQILKGSSEYGEFPLDTFVSGPWARYSADCRLVGFVCGLVGSLLIAWVIERVKRCVAEG